MPLVFVLGVAVVLAVIAAVPILYWGCWRIDVPTGCIADLKDPAAE